VVAAAAGLLIASGNVQGAGSDPLLNVAIGASTEARLSHLDRAELKITWREDGPTLAVASLDATTDPVREPERMSAAPTIAGCFLVAPCEFTTRNRLGGGLAVAGRADAKLATDGGDRFVRLGFNAGGSTPRVTIDLFGNGSDNAVFYLDGLQFARFELRVRAAEPVVLAATLIDAYGRRAPEVSLSFGSSSEDWQVVTIETAAESIHEHHLATPELRGDGDARFDLDDIYLCAADARSSRTAPTPTPTPNVNSMWVWHTSDLLAGGEAPISALAGLSAEAGIGRIYLQLPSGFGTAPTQAAVGRVVASLGAAEIEVFALDGAPGYALPPGRRDLMRNVGRLVDYQAAANAAARFAGPHLDVEPYLLPEWNKDRVVVRSFLETLDGVRKGIATRDLKLDVTVPFWFDGIVVHETEGEHVRATSLTREILDRADSIAVMDCRTQTGTSNGMLALGAAELATAAELGKQVWLGLETTWLPDETLVRFRGAPTPGLPQAGTREWWVVEAAGLLWAVRANELEQLHDRLDPAERASSRHWTASTVEVPATRQTFHDLGFEQLLGVMAEATQELEGHPAFAGFALHYDRPLRRPLDASKN